jgi:hypothetical protein
MIFVFPITTPPNTPATAPLVTTMNLTAGTITKMDIQYPLGVSGLAHIQISYGLNQIFPNNPDGSFATSNETITWEEDFDLTGPPYSLFATTWNLDPNWPHTITVRIVMQAAEYGAPDLKTQIEQLLGVGGA